jgi:hypothetical protein
MGFTQNREGVAPAAGQNRTKANPFSIQWPDARQKSTCGAKQHLCALCVLRETASS